MAGAWLVWPRSWAYWGPPWPGWRWPRSSPKRRSSGTRTSPAARGRTPAPARACSCCGRRRPPAKAPPTAASRSVVEVWHQTGGETLVQATGIAPAAPGSASRTPAADNQDPDGILGVSDRLLALLESNYQVVYAGHGSADNRAALVVEVKRPGGGVAARFWVDAATKLPLRREIFAGDARMISEDSFTSLHLGNRGLDTMPKPAAAPWTAQLGGARLAALRAKGWPLPAQLPGSLVLFAATERSGSSGSVIDVSYSDGLNVVSLFVQRGSLAGPVPGW